MRHNATAAAGGAAVANGAAADELASDPRSPVQVLRDSLRGESTVRLPARLGGSAVRLPHSLFAGVLLAATLALLLLGPTWVGSSWVGAPSGAPPSELLHLDTAAIPPDGGGGSSLAAMAKAALPCKKCKKCAKCPEWARIGTAADVEKYGTQYFALCIAIKDQQQDIREWVAHHHFIGAGKIYLYDTGSSPPLNETIADHISSRLVEYIWWGSADFGSEEARQYPQNIIYQDCMDRFGSAHQFIGFIDSDEFIVLRGGTPSVPALLQRLMAFEPIGGLVINWRFFGSSGHRRRQKKGVLQSYTKCLPRQNLHSVHVKSIVNTDHYDRVDGPHHWLYQEPYHAVNEHFQFIDGPMTANVSIDKIVLHHYVLKSEEEYREKMDRGSAMGNHKPFSFFKAIDEGAIYTCKDGLKYGPYD